MVPSPDIHTNVCFPSGPAHSPSVEVIVESDEASAVVIASPEQGPRGLRGLRGKQGPPGQDAGAVVPYPIGIADGQILATSGEAWVITAPPSGAGGTGGDGVTFIQDTAPILASDKETWWNPTTKQLKVYNNSAWGTVAPDGGYF